MPVARVEVAFRPLYRQVAVALEGDVERVGCASYGTRPRIAEDSNLLREGDPVPAARMGNEFPEHKSLALVGAGRHVGDIVGDDRHLVLDHQLSGQRHGLCCLHVVHRPLAVSKIRHTRLHGACHDHKPM